MDKIIDGKLVAARLREELKKQVETAGLAPSLAIILVGDDERSRTYIKQKQNAASEVGAKTVLIELTGDTKQEDLEKEIERLNNDKEIDGIIVQLPLPSHLEQEKILQLVEKNKDVDGLVIGSPFLPATPKGIMTLLAEYKVPVNGKVAVVLGQSQLVGSPLSNVLEKEGAKVIRIDVNTPKPIEPLVQQGDIVIAAVGKINLVTADMIKDGAVVVDVGTNVNPDTGKLVGDVDFENVKEKASLITPVPGGVGPMTVISLLQNLFLASRRRQNL